MKPNFSLAILLLTVTVQLCVAVHQPCLALELVSHQSVRPLQPEPDLSPAAARPAPVVSAPPPALPPTPVEGPPAALAPAGGARGTAAATYPVGQPGRSMSKAQKCGAVATAIEEASPATRVVTTTNIWQLAHTLKLSLPLPQARVVVLKSRRCLQLWSKGILVQSFRVALGANPVGAKSGRGDGRTPEGNFFICSRNCRTSGFHIFLGLSYPALPDATRAISSRAITWRDFQTIKYQLASRAAPLWRTRLGGWVGIHGGNNSQFAARRIKQRGRSDWTSGCIGLTDFEIEELYAATRYGTPVSIKP